jgi:hypothetical protein
MDMVMMMMTKTVTQVAIANAVRFSVYLQACVIAHMAFESSVAPSIVQKET